MNKGRTLILFILMLVVTALAFSAFNGRMHLFDWDEINFAESAREMIVTNDYLTVRIDYLPFWEKPPLFIAMQAASMKIFGVNEMAARFPNTLAGILTMVVLFLTGSRFFNQRFGLYWAIAYASSLLPFLYFKSGLIDPWFNLLIFSGVVSFIVYDQQGRKVKWLVVSAFLIGLAVLTKGPVALLLVLLTAFIVFLLKRFRNFVPFRAVLMWTGVFLATGGLWFLLMAISGKADTIVRFFVYQVRLFSTEDAGHGGFPLYHVVVLLIGAFPASVIAIPSFFRNRAADMDQVSFRRWMMVLFLVVLVLFSVVKTKIVHYSSLCYFPLTFLATLEVIWLSDNRKRFSKGVAFLLVFILSIWMVFSLAAPLALGPFKGTLMRIISSADEASKAMVAAPVTWPWYTFLPAAVLILTLILFLAVRKNVLRKAVVLALGSFLFVNLAAWFFAYRAEGYSQRADIEFFRGLAGKDVYTRTLGLKSYANYFYFRKNPPSDQLSYSKSWQLFGPVDKPVYCSFSLKNKEDYLKRYYNLEPLYEENGFVFCVRKPPMKPQP